jgi:hypothetical protein
MIFTGKKLLCILNKCRPIMNKEGRNVSEIKQGLTVSVNLLCFCVNMGKCRDIAFFVLFS